MKVNIKCMKMVWMEKDENSHKAMDIFYTGRGEGGGSLQFLSFWGYFPHITKAVFDDENSTKSQNIPPKSDH